MHGQRNIKKRERERERERDGVDFPRFEEPDPPNCEMKWPYGSRYLE